MTDVEVTTTVWVDDLDESVCWRLLAKGVLGRVAFVIDGQPCALPVNYHLAGGAIVFRTRPDSSLAGLVDGALVAFEIDDADYHAETGWSVVVKGPIAALRTEQERAALGPVAIHPWAPGQRDHWMHIGAVAVTGRAISRRRSHPDGPLLPYMLPD